MVHGILSSSAQWMNNLPALQQCCRPITVDLWGHGRSPSPHLAKYYDPGHWVEQFDAIRKELGVDRWFLLGYSLGTGATIRYALTHPQRVHGHIFTNSASGFADPALVEANIPKTNASAAKILQDGVKALEKIPVHPRHARRLPPRTYNALVRDARSLNPRGVANILRYSIPSLSVRNAITTNTVPALLICGSKERRFLPHRDYAATHMPNLAIANLETGHAVNMQDAKNFNALASKFIRRWSDPSHAS